MIRLRYASSKDFKSLYDLGSQTPELRVSSTEPFMDKDDFKRRLTDRGHVFIVAQEHRLIVGFICASTTDTDRPLKSRYACIVYLVVHPDYRRRGVGLQLYEECVRRLKVRGITHIYAWADGKSKGIQRFLGKQGFSRGKTCVWMDGKI